MLAERSEDLRALIAAGLAAGNRILNSRIENCAWPLIHVTSTSGLTIKGNILPSVPPAANQAQAIDPMVLEQCETK